MAALYNELEPYAAEWIRNLVAAGHVAEGIVDGRSIKELRAADLEGRTQCHFFAGIGAWSYALRLAGVADTTSVWTGSCPCQPFSTAGRGKGLDDERHLWPEWFRLIRECRPAIVFGEQVASPDGLAWLDLVSSDLEGAGYAVGAADLCAASVGAPHIRQRLFFVAIADEQRREGLGVSVRERGSLEAGAQADWRGAADVVADAAESGWESGGTSEAGDGRDAPWLEPRRLRAALGMGNADIARSQGRRSGRHGADEWIAWTPGLDHWNRVDWIACTDGKHRPVEPGTRPLAHGATSRVGRLRAYGNAISPQVAASFIRAVMA